MENTLAEVMPDLPAGTPVLVHDDNSIGYVERQQGPDVHVVFPNRVFGRGPFIFFRGQVEAA